MTGKKYLRIDIRNDEMPGKRLTLSSRTTSGPEYKRRYAAVSNLVTAKAWDLIEALRSRKLTVEDLTHPVETLRRWLTGQPAPEDAMTLGAQVTRLLTTVKATKADSTWSQYDIICRMLLDRFGPGAVITTIRSEALQAWLHEPKSTTKGKPWSRARQVLAMAIIGRLFNTAIAIEDEAAEAENRAPRIRRNPARNVELPEDRGGRVEFLRPVEWQALSKAVEDRAVHVLVALGMLAGLRIGECAHLRVGIDVVLDEKPYLEIQPREGKYPWKPKRKRSMRKVPIGKELLRIIQRHIELGYSGERYLIISRPERDQPMHRQVLEQWTAKAFRAAGIRYGRKADALTHHSLRHSFISMLVMADVSLKKIEKLAGTSIRMIDRVYSHLATDDLELAITTVDLMAKS